MQRCPGHGLTRTSQELAFEAAIPIGPPCVGMRWEEIFPLADSGDDGEGNLMSAYVEAKHAEAQRRRADLLAQVELAERAGCKSMAEMAEFLNRSGFHNADGGPWNAHSFQTSLARLRASTPDTAEERPGADVAQP